MTYVQQGTPEWHLLRLGHATGSRFKDVLATIKSGEAASRRNYRAQLVCELLTNRYEETYQSAEMRRGTEKEPYARSAYSERYHDAFLVQTGFIKHPAIEWMGASVDFLVDDDGQGEIKCPNTATHIETLRNGMDPEHLPQIQGGLSVTGRQWCDFISYDDRLPEHMQLYVQRVHRDDIYIAKLNLAVALFIGEVQAELEELNKKYPRP